MRWKYKQHSEIMIIFHGWAANKIRWFWENCSYFDQIVEEVKEEQELDVEGWVIA